MTSRKEVKKLLDDAAIIEHTNTVEALKLANEALAISKENNYIKEQTKALIRIGRCFWISGEYIKARQYLSEALEIAEKQKYHYEYTDTQIALGNTYATQTLPIEANKHYNLALKIANLKNYHELEGRIYNNKGTIHEELKDYDNALIYYELSLKTTAKLNDLYSSAIASLNIGNTYLQKNNLEKAMFHLNKTYKYSLENNKNILLAHTHLSFGQYYSKIEDYQKSIEALKQGVEYAKISQDLIVMVKIFVELALSYEYIGNIDKAIKYFNKAETQAIELHLKKYILTIYQEMSRFYEKNNNNDLANIYYKKYFKASNELEKNILEDNLKSIDFQSELKITKQKAEDAISINKILKDTNKKLQALSEIGHTITATNNLEIILSNFYENVKKLMDLHLLAVFIYNEGTKSLDNILYIDGGAYRESFSIPLINKKSFNVHSFKNNKMLLLEDTISKAKNEFEKIPIHNPELIKSALFVPVNVANKPIGVLTVQSQKRKAYNKNEIDIVKLLSSYLAIAVNNYKRSAELNAANKKLERLSNTDGLTGLANRRMFDKTYKEIWDDAYDKQNFIGLCLLDIDCFKDFNDDYGHLIGDDVLKIVGRTFNDFQADKDCFAARYGGDEFVFIIPNANKQIIKDYDKNIRNTLIAINKEISVGRRIDFSMGCFMMLPSKENDITDLIKITDKLLYKEKDIKKNVR